jgi:hypothetical protein
MRIRDSGSCTANRRPDALTAHCIEAVYYMLVSEMSKTPSPAGNRRTLACRQEVHDFALPLL